MVIISDIVVYEGDDWCVCIWLNHPQSEQGAPTRQQTKVKGAKRKAVGLSCKE